MRMRLYSLLDALVFLCIGTAATFVSLQPEVAQPHGQSMSSGLQTRIGNSSESYVGESSETENAETENESAVRCARELSECRVECGLDPSTISDGALLEYRRLVRSAQKSCPDWSLGGIQIDCRESPCLLCGDPKTTTTLNMLTTFQCPQIGLAAGAQLKARSLPSDHKLHWCIAAPSDGSVISEARIKDRMDKLANVQLDTGF